MKIDESSIDTVLRLVETNRWPNGIPVVGARLRLAINSLLSQDRDIFSKDPAEVLRLIDCDKNPGIRVILGETGIEVFAFAICVALEAKKRPVGSSTQSDT